MNELAGRFWDLGNLICGFGAAQALGYAALVYSSREYRDFVRLSTYRRWLIAGIWAFAAIYCGAIYFCHCAENALLHDDPDLKDSALAASLRGWACIGRMGAILLFTGLYHVAIRYAETERWQRRDGAA